MAYEGLDLAMLSGVVWRTKGATEVERYFELADESELYEDTIKL